MLLQLYRKTASSTFENFDFNALMEDMAKDGYTGTLSDLRAKIAELFKVPIEKAVAQGGQLLGDLFFQDDKLFYLKCRLLREEGGEPNADVFDDPGGSFSVVKVDMEAGLIASMGEADAGDLDTFCDGIATILEVKFDAADIKWQMVTDQEEERPSLKGNAATTPSESDIELAGILRDGKLEPLFAALQDNKGELIIDKWLEERDDAEEIEYFIDKLFEADFFDEEIVVYSKGQPVFRANDRSSLEALKAAGIRDVNGDPLDTDDVRRLIKMAADKEDHLSLSWQANIFLIDLLFKVGLTNKDILALDNLNGTAMMLAYYGGEPILFLMCDDGLEAEAFAELKDLFEQIGKPHVVAICRGDVDPDAAEAAGAASCTVINEMTEFNAKLLELFSANREKKIEIALGDFNHMISVNVVGMTMARFADEA